MRCAASLIAWALVVAACADPQVPTCSGDEVCGGDAICAAGFCVADPAPRLRLVADRSEARIDEAVRLDAGASLAPGAGRLQLEFQAEPAEAVELEGDPEDPLVATLRFVRPHHDVRVRVVATTAGGRSFHDEVEIAFRNSPPIASLGDRSAQPGEVVELEVEASDPDGDSLDFSWHLDEGEGALEAEGSKASLSIHGDEAHLVQVVVRDGQGGEAVASTWISTRNRAPRIRPGPATRVDHRCSRAPPGCSAAAVLRPSIEDVGPLRYGWRLLDEEALEVEALFAPADSPSPTVTLRCAPFCEIAGSYRIELTATDEWGAASTAQLELSVENRPPLVFAHDDEALAPIFVGSEEGANLYRLERPLGAFLFFYDPDGDPLDPHSVEWRISAGEVALDPGDPAASAGLVVTAPADALRTLEISVTAADVYGAAASDRRTIPLEVTPPTIVRFADGLEGGHGHDGDVHDTIRRRLPPEALEISNPMGLPYHEVLAFDPADAGAAARGARIEGGPGAWSIAGPHSILDADYRLRARIWNDWGHEESATATWRISNRQPGLRAVDPAALSIALSATASESCCGIDGCSEVGTQWSPPTPLTEVGAVSGLLEILPEDDDEITVLAIYDFEAALGHWEVGEPQLLRELPTEVSCDPHHRDGICEVAWAFPGGGCGASVRGARGSFLLFAIDPHGLGSEPLEIRIELD